MSRGKDKYKTNGNGNEIKSEAQFIDCLDTRVSHLYTRIKLHEDYSKGEIDYMGLRFDGYWDIYEVKRSQKGIGKAKQQLRRTKDYLKKTGDLYIYIGLEDKLMLYDGKE